MKHFYYLILLLTLCGCSFGKKQPLWVTQMPVDNAFYSAVVRINRRASNYVDLARDNALKEISTQISVQIDAAVALNETEANGIPSAEIINQIRSSSRNKLANVQLAGTYQTDKDYWAYYRLSKSEYLAWRQKQRDNSIIQAKELLSEFDNATSDAASGITALLQAMELIVDFVDMDLSTVYNEKRVNIYNEAFSRLQRLPERLIPEFSQNELNVVAKQKQRHIVPVSMKYTVGSVGERSANREIGNAVICKAFPLVFSFRSGSGDIVNKTLSDNMGSAELIIRQISEFTDPQYIELRPDKDYWQARIENPVIKRMLELLQFPPATLKLNVSRPKAFLDYSFDNTPGSSYRDILVKKLQDLDLEVVADSTKSDFILKVIVISRDGEFVSRLNLYTASADAYVELLHSQGYKSIYNTNLTNIKSTGNSAEIARKMIELNSIGEICDKLLFMLVERHIMQ